jgi:hypothetical protein
MSRLTQIDGPASALANLQELEISAFRGVAPISTCLSRGNEIVRPQGEFLEDCTRAIFSRYVDACSRLVIPALFVVMGSWALRNCSSFASNVIPSPDSVNNSITQLCWQVVHGFCASPLRTLRGGAFCSNHTSPLHSLFPESRCQDGFSLGRTDVQ